MRLVVDASVWIKFLRREPRICERLTRAMSNDDEVIVTPVAYYEVMRGLKKRNDQANIETLSTLWDGCYCAEATRAVWREAVGLWVQSVKANQLRGDADTITAAFASLLGATIATTDAHFGIFHELGIPVEDWSDSAA